MNADDSTPKPFRLDTNRRQELAAYLRPELAEQALAILEALITANPTLPEFVQEEQPRRTAKPSEVARRRDRAIRALKSLAKVVPFDRRNVYLGFVKMLKCERELLPTDRKADRRGEFARMLCGWIGKMWPTHACEPANKTARRRFALLFLDACGSDHSLDGHPEQLDAWLDQDTPAGWSVVERELVEELIRKS